MGILISRVWGALQGLQEKRILLLGLDGGGKTTILYSLKLGECITTIPTIGFNVERVEYGGLDMSMWDVGGQAKIRRLWRHYYENSNALIFVVDSNDGARIEDAAQEFHAILEAPEVQRSLTHVLVYANKQDLPHSMDTMTVMKKLGLAEHRNLHRLHWHVQGCCATSGSGIYEGLDWLAQSLRKHRAA